jgi:hypothetical protein
MSVELAITIDDKEVMATIDTFELSLMGIGEKLANDIADWIVIQTKNHIIAEELYVSGELYGSVNKTNQGDTIIVSVDAPYAVPLERGSNPSPGRYVPDIDRRLIHPTRRVTKWGTENEIIEIENPLGEHPGNRPYRFFEQAINDVLGFTDEDWMKRNAEGGLP